MLWSEDPSNQSHAHQRNVIRHVLAAQRRPPCSSGRLVSRGTGEEMQKVLADVYATPKALVARLAEASRSKPDLKVLEGQKKREKKK